MSLFRKLLIAAILLPTLATAAVVTRVGTFTDGDVLFASDLNSEFNNLVNNINALDDDNISDTANIDPKKIGASIAGDGLARAGSTGILSVNDDDTTLAITGDVLAVKTNGIGNTQLRQSAALSVVGNATNATANVADIAAASDGQVLRRSGTAIAFGTVATAGLADASVTAAKKAALNASLSSSSGTFSSSTSASFTDVTNLSVSITTNGRPVEIKLISDGTEDGSGNAGSVLCQGSAAASGGARLKVLRDSTDVAFRRVSSGNSSDSGIETISFSSSLINEYDAPAAGTYTYKVQIRVNSTNTCTVYKSKLLVYEL